MARITDLVFDSTTELAAALRSRHVSAVEVLQAYLARIDQYNPTLNAIVTLDADRAYARAKEADAALARGEVWGPLHGVPYTLKDALATAGMRTTTGFAPLDHVPQHDSTVASRIKAAGGILIGKTNVPVMLADFQTSNPIFGRTHNPWNIERTAGGSSGGAAAAIAAGLTAFDIGTDMSGSIRIPAAYCGISGLKPTEHRVSLGGIIPGLPPTRSVRLMSCPGPMARTIEDLALVLSLIAGPDGEDTDVPPVRLDGLRATGLAGLNLAYAPTFPGFAVAEDVQRAIEALADDLRRSGARVEAAPLPPIDFLEDLQRAGTLIGMMVGAFQPDENTSPTTLAEYLEALHRRDQSMLAWEQFFDTWDALLCPASMVTAFPHCEPGSPLRVNGAEEPYWMVSAHTTLFNYTGHPAVVLPWTRDREDLPIGVQLVGKRWDESRLLGIAAAVEGVTGGFRRPPAYT